MHKCTVIKFKIEASIKVVLHSALRRICGHSHNTVHGRTNDCFDANYRLKAIMLPSFSFYVERESEGLFGCMGSTFGSKITSFIINISSDINLWKNKRHTHCRPFKASDRLGRTLCRLVCEQRAQFLHSWIAVISWKWLSFFTLFNSLLFHLV